jgi:hypothetical protein
MKYLTFIFCLLYWSTHFGQTEEALVYFTDKEDVATALDNPLSILSQDALDRKNLHGIVVDERDVPVNEAYISILKTQPGITVHSKSKWLNAAYVSGPQSQVEALQDLAFVSGVEFMDKTLNLAPVPLVTTDKFETERESQRAFFNYGDAANQIEMIGGDFLHQQEFEGDGMVIAVLDSGFPGVVSNPAFNSLNDENRLLGTFDFVLDQGTIGGSSSHGALVLSDMAAEMDGIFVGTAPKASYYLFRTEDAASERPVEEAYWVEALERADSLGVDVINTSLGYQDFDDPSYDHQYEDLDGQTTLAARGANIAFEKGMLLVTSAGNDGNGFTYVATPGDAIGMLTVGAVDPSGSYASFSSIGPTVDGRIKPDVMAQGQDAAIVYPDGFVGLANGTSFSSPILAGAISCLWQSRPEVRNELVMQAVRESAHLYNNPTDLMGYGIPDLEDAYNMLQLLANQQAMRKVAFALYPNPVREWLSISFPEGLDLAEYTLSDLTGKRIDHGEMSRATGGLDMAFLPDGVYLLAITTVQGVQSFKIVKQ